MRSMSVMALYKFLCMTHRSSKRPCSQGDTRKNPCKALQGLAQHSKISLISRVSRGYRTKSTPKWAENWRLRQCGTSPTKIFAKTRKGMDAVLPLIAERRSKARAAARLSAATHRPGQHDIHWRPRRSTATGGEAFREARQQSSRDDEGRSASEAPFAPFRPRNRRTHPAAASACRPVR